MMTVQRAQTSVLVTVPLDLTTRIKVVYPVLKDLTLIRSDLRSVSHALKDTSQIQKVQTRPDFVSLAL